MTRNPALKLEVGKFFRTAGGDEITIVREYRGRSWVFFESDAGWIYRPDGKVRIASDPDRFSEVHTIVAELT